MSVNLSYRSTVALEGQRQVAFPIMSPIVSCGPGCRHSEWLNVMVGNGVAPIPT